MNLIINAQIPRDFNFQAIARNGSGNTIKNATINVMISILSDTSGNPEVMYEELFTATRTNEYGMFNIVVGTGEYQSGLYVNFSDVKRDLTPLYMRAKVYYNSTWISLAQTYKTPGVYVEEITKSPPSIAAVETAIPAFIGYTEKAEDKNVDDLILKPKRISSMSEYEKYFGNPEPEEKIKVRINEKQDADKNTIEIKAEAELNEEERSVHIMHYALQMFFTNGGGKCYIVSIAKYKDSDLADFKNGLDAIQKEDEPTLIIFPESQRLNINDFKTLQDDALVQCDSLKDRFLIIDVHGDDISLSKSDSDILAAIQNFRDKGIGNINLKYGAAYAPNVETNIEFFVDENMIDVIHSVNGEDETSVKLKSLIDTDNSLYEIAKTAIRDYPCKLPPSSAIAGVYVTTDKNRGVWKAPANVSLNAVIQPAINISSYGQEQINVDVNSGKSVNAIRAFSGKGTLVWGARTLAGNDNEWRSINVRRFFNFVEESTKKVTEPFIFEPNEANTWVKVQAMIENFLIQLWREGALQGVKPEHAFYVAVGLGKTMTETDILEGRMIIEIGMAVIRPAEFIILRFSHKMQE